MTRPGFMLISKALTKIFWASPSPYSCTLTPTLGLELLASGGATPQICSHSQFCPLTPPSLPACTLFFLHELYLELCERAVWLFRRAGWGRKGWQWIGNDLCRPAPPKPCSTQPCLAKEVFRALLTTAGVSAKICPWQKN